MLRFDRHSSYCRTGQRRYKREAIVARLMQKSGRTRYPVFVTIPYFPATNGPRIPPAQAADNIVGEPAAV
jgi:hypothetical protein